jgi:hypothetical protein
VSKRVQHVRLCVGDVGDRRRQRKHEVEIAHSQKVSLTLRQPFPRCRTLTLWTMPVAAGIVGNERVAAGLVLAARDMAAERRRAAALDGAHHLQLVEADVTAVGFTPSGTVVAEDVRDL